MGAFDTASHSCLGARLKVLHRILQRGQRSMILGTCVPTGLEPLQPINEDCQKGLVRYAVDAVSVGIDRPDLSTGRSIVPALAGRLLCERRSRPSLVRCFAFSCSLSHLRHIEAQADPGDCLGGHGCTFPACSAWRLAALLFSWSWFIRIAP